MAITALADKKAKQLVEEVCATIRGHYPEATFEVYESKNLKAICVEAYTREEEVWPVLSLVHERVSDALADEGTNLVVIPMPLESHMEASKQNAEIAPASRGEELPDAPSM